MRNIRTKKLKTEAARHFSGPFDDSIILMLLQMNEKCMQLITKNQLDKAQEVLKQIKIDGDMVSYHHKERNSLKSLSLNTEAYCLQRQKKYPEALKCLEEAETYQSDNDLIESARTKLSKSVVMSHLGKNTEAIELGKRALQLLKKHKEWNNGDMKKSQLKIYEIMILSFYSIANDLSHLSEVIQANNIYKEGFYLAHRIVGPSHKLTLLLKNIVNRKKSLSRSKEKSESNHSEFKSLRMQTRDTKISITNFNPINLKEKEIKRIYANRQKANSFISVNNRFTRKDIRYYLNSLEKIKVIYSKNNFIPESLDPTPTEQDPSEQNSSMNRIKKMFTESTNSNRCKENLEHMRTKDIILNGRPINKRVIIGNALRLSTSISNAPTQSLNDKYEKSQEIIEPPLKTQPIERVELELEEQVQVQQNLTLAYIAQKVEEKQQANNSQDACQLI